VAARQRTSRSCDSLNFVSCCVPQICDRFAFIHSWYSPAYVQRVSMCGDLVHYRWVRRIHFWFYAVISAIIQWKPRWAGFELGGFVQAADRFLRLARIRWLQKPRHRKSSVRFHARVFVIVRWFLLLQDFLKLQNSNSVESGSNIEASVVNLWTQTFWADHVFLHSAQGGLRCLFGRLEFQKWLFQKWLFQKMTGNEKCRRGK